MTGKDYVKLEIAREQVKQRLAIGNETQRWIKLLLDKVRQCDNWKSLGSILEIWSLRIPKKYDYLLYDAIPEELRK